MLEKFAVSICKVEVVSLWMLADYRKGEWLLRTEEEGSISE
jgi:hypothetical protein